MGNLVESPSTIVIANIVYLGLCVFIFIGFVFFIRHFEDPNDKGGYFNFFVSWLLYSVTSCIILLLPFDVMCQPDSRLYMPLIWEIFMFALVIFILICLPFSICCYEEDGGLRAQICTGICWTGIFDVGFVILSLVLYLIIGYAEVPFETEVGNYLVFDNVPEELINRYADEAWGTTIAKPIEVRMTYPVYAVCVLSVLGWGLFIIFGGCGVTAFPLGLITDFCYRPKRLGAHEFVEFKLKMNKQIDALMDATRGFRIALSAQVASPDKTDKKLSKEQKEEMIRLRQEVERVCANYDQIAYVEAQNSYNVLIPYIKLVIGCIGLIIVLLWLVQILVCDLIQAGYFISDALRFLDDNVLFLGAAFYGIMVVFFTLGIIKGNVTIGTRCLIVSFYPMQAHNTLPNAILFNGGLYAIAAFALIQFSASEFQTYVKNSGVNALFTNQMRNMKGIKYLFRYFSWALFIFMIIGVFFSLTFDICCKACAKKKIDKKNAMPKL